MKIRIPAVSKARIMVLVGFLFSLGGATVFRTPVALFLAAALFAAPAVTSVLSRWGQKSLTVARTFPSTGMAGDLVTARVTIANRSGWPLFLVHCQAGEMFLGHGSSLPVLRPAACAADHVIPMLNAGASAEVETSWRLCQRGVHHLTPAAIGTVDPLGLHNRLQPRTGSREILVLPRPLLIGRLGWSGGMSGGARTSSSATRVADAMDFHGVRPHLPGEGLRRVHWKSTARTGTLHVIDWEDEMAADLTVFLDVQAGVQARSAGDGRGTANDASNDSLEAAIVVAATVTAYLLENGYQVQLMFWEKNPGGGIRLGRCEGRQRGALGSLLGSLARIEAVNDGDAGLVRRCRPVGAIFPRAFDVVGNDRFKRRGSSHPRSGECRKRQT